MAVVTRDLKSPTADLHRLWVLETRPDPGEAPLAPLLPRGTGFPPFPRTRRRAMRARALARALLAALTPAELLRRAAPEPEPDADFGGPDAPGPGAGTTRAGDVAVLLWEDTYETGVDGKPTTVVIDLQDGEPNDVSVNTLRALSADVAAAASSSPRIERAPAAWERPRAALVDEVHSAPSTDVIVTSPCLLPNSRTTCVGRSRPRSPRTCFWRATARTSGTLRLRRRTCRQPGAGPGVGGRRRPERRHDVRAGRRCARWWRRPPTRASTT